MDSSQFWDNKALRYGHTGNADPFIYGFDQSARIFIINSILKRQQQHFGLMLDFGCGSGDFIPGLLRHGERLVAYDISQVMRKALKSRLTHQQVKIAETLNNIETEGPYHLILTVTVLQHLQASQIAETLTLFKNCLRQNGLLICMEFFPLQSNPETPYTDANAWLNLLAQNNFEVSEIKQVYNPVDFPSASWLAYKKHPMVRLFGLVKNFNFAKKYFRHKAQTLINQYQDLFMAESGQYRVYQIRHKT